MDEKKNESKENGNSKQDSAKPRTRRGRKSNTTENSQTKKRGAESAEETSTSKEPANFQESVLYLKKIGLKKVSNKTFINEADLAAFLAEDFTNINKTRALGFIQILEREYPVQLEELKKSYLSYHQQNRQKKREDLFVQPKIEKEPEWKKYLLWGMPLVLVVLGSWYFATQEKSALSTLESEQEAVSTDINTDIVVEAEKNLTAYQQHETVEPTDEEVISSPRVSPFRRGVVPGTSQTQSSTVVHGADDNTDKSKSDDLDLDKMVKQMVQEYNLTLEENATAVTDTATAQATAASQNSTEANKSLPKVAIAEKTSAKKSIEKKSVSEKKSAAKKRPKQSKKVSQDVINSKLYIVPHKKSWVGIIYLDDYSKKDFLIRRTLKLNSTRPQLIVVGQKEFEIFNNGYSYRFRGKGPVRFIYQNGDIMEITNREFRKYSKGTAW